MSSPSVWLINLSVGSGWVRACRWWALAWGLVNVARPDGQRARSHGSLDRGSVGLSWLDGGLRGDLRPGGAPEVCVAGARSDDSYPTARGGRTRRWSRVPGGSQRPD